MIDQEKARKLLSQMVLIREFELACAEQYSHEYIRGFLHLYIGQEAVCVGVIDNLLEQDSIFTTYREHGHAIARGISPKKVMAELFGKVEGASRGRGGSMHIFDRETRFFGGNAIVGAAIPPSVGMALAHKTSDDGGISVCFFGEGAVAEGEFHEAMNLASLWKVPVLFVCENNLYAMGTSFSRSEAQKDLVFKAKSYGVEADNIDGMDILEVNEAVANITDFIRSKREPFFVECRTYRYRAHSMYDPELYRQRDEVERWKARDPIINFKSYLEKNKILENHAIEDIEVKSHAMVLEAIEFAKNGTIEKLGDLHKYIYLDD